MKNELNTNTRKLNKKMIERLIIIHNAIKSGSYPNNRALRDIYCKKTGYAKVGEATVNRDIDTLRTYFKAPLDYDRQKGGYYYFDDWDLAVNSISAQDIFYLSAVKTLLSHFAGSPMYDEIASVIDFVSGTQNAGKSRMLSRIAIPPTPKTTANADIWTKILQSLQENVIIEFDYNGRWRTETTHRRVHPYQILLDDGMHFVFGYSEERKAERIFSLSRIKNLVVTEEHFDLPQDHDFAARCGGGKFGLFMGDKMTKFVIDFFGDAREYVKDYIWADDQIITDFDDEDRTRIEFSSTQTLKVREWVLSQGANAIPVSPEQFVEEWRQTIREMAENVAD